jgi:hypothetical protein
MNTDFYFGFGRDAFHRVPIFQQEVWDAGGTRPYQRQFLGFGCNLGRVIR